MLLESLCKKVQNGEQCTCVGPDTRFCPGGRQLYETGGGPEVEVGGVKKRVRGHGPVLAPQFYPPRHEGEPDALRAPETCDRDSLFDWVLEQFNARKKFLDGGGFKGAKDLCTALLAVIGPPGAGKSHIANELSRQRYHKLVDDYGKDLVVSVCTFYFGMPVRQKDSLLFRLVFGAFANMAPEDAVREVVKDRKPPLSTVPKCLDMVTDFDTALESWRSKLEAHGFEDYEPEVQDMPSILTHLYGRKQGTNVLIVADEISKTKGEPPNEALRQQAESIRQVLLNTNSSVYLLTTALWGREEQITYVTKRNNIVLPKYLHPLQGPSVQELVTECDGNIPKGMLKQAPVRGILKLSAGNARLVEYTWNYLRGFVDSPTESGKEVEDVAADAGQRVVDAAANEKNARGVPFMTMAKWQKAMASGGSRPLPDTTTAAALAYVLRKPPAGSSSTDVVLNSRRWESAELRNAISTSSLIVYELMDDAGKARTDLGRLDVLPLALLKFVTKPDRDVTLDTAAAAGIKGTDEVKKLLEFLDYTYLYEQAPSRDLADPSERIVMFLYALGISRGGKFAKAVLGKTVAGDLGLASEKGVEIRDIEFTPASKIPKKPELAGGSPWASTDCHVRFLLELVDGVVRIVELGNDYPGVDFVIIYDGKAFPVQVKRDSLVWSLDYAPNAQKIRDLAERVNLVRGSNEPVLDAEKDTRALAKLSLCDVAFQKLTKTEIRKRLDGADDFPRLFTHPAGAFFGFDTADIRKDCLLLHKEDYTEWPDRFVDATAVERDVPLGLLEVATLTGESWLGGPPDDDPDSDDEDDDDAGEAENNSGHKDAENAHDNSPDQVR